MHFKLPCKSPRQLSLACHDSWEAQMDKGGWVTAQATYCCRFGASLGHVLGSDGCTWINQSWSPFNYQLPLFPQPKSDTFFMCTASLLRQSKILPRQSPSIFLWLISYPRIPFVFLMIDEVRFCVHSLLEQANHFVLKYMIMFDD